MTTNMVIQFVIIFIFFGSVVSQYMDDNIMRPDVTFGEQNDRFDITSIIDEQNRFYNKDYRRNPNHKDKYTVVKEETAKINGKMKESNIINALGNVFKSMRRSDPDFAYHDTMRDDENGNIGDFEENLEKLKQEGEEKEKLEEVVLGLHDGQKLPRRRSEGAYLENEVLLHYAFPVTMRLNGYLKLPLTS